MFDWLALSGSGRFLPGVYGDLIDPYHNQKLLVSCSGMDVYWKWSVTLGSACDEDCM